MKMTTMAAAIAATAMISTLPAAHAENPYDMEDASWISLSGTVVATSPESFELDYGTGIVTVEMDDWGWYEKARLLLVDDQVVVQGYIDEDFYESTSIEAGSVYVRDMNTYFYANDDDEEDIAFPTLRKKGEATMLQLRGVVSEIDGMEFTLDTGPRRMRVDTSNLEYNPLDNKGVQKITAGDFVIVQGAVETDMFEDPEIMAESITSVVQDATKKAKERRAP